MLCVCLSFPITELCLLKRRSDAFLISAFLTDEEQALSAGSVCFKHRFTSHSLFTSDTIHCRRSCSALNFLDLYSLSCSVIKCIVSLRSGLLWRDAEKNEITYRVFFLFKAAKIHRREQSLCGEDAHNTVGASAMYPVYLKLITIIVINS